MALRYKKMVLSHVGHKAYTPAQAHILAKDLGVPEEEFEDFQRAIESLAEEGQVVFGDDKLVTLPPMGREVIGRFKKNPKGFGFVIPEDKNQHGDLFIPPEASMDAVTGDTVRAKTFRRRGGPGGGGAIAGEIVEIIERGRTKFTGTLRRQGGIWVADPDGKTIMGMVALRDAESRNARVGDKVVFEMVEYPEGDMLGEGVIVQTLGEAGEPDVETEAVIAAFALPGEFPEECVEQAREASRDFHAQVKAGDLEGRLDLRDGFIITIDPPDAKDFDDAISIERTGDGGWRLGVHIADVAHFIPPGSPLDEEARKRGNSVYLPRRVIPMLPEVLSNGICSLQEGVDRFTKSVFIELDRKAHVRGARFANAVIRSAKRLTYLEAQALIDGNEREAERHAKSKPEYSEQLKRTVRDMNELSRLILARRMEQGMIRLELPDAELVYGEDGRVKDVEPEDDAFTHTVIEMFMVEANEAAGRLFENAGVPLLRRIHPDPPPGNMDELQRFVSVAGFKISKSPTREELQSLLEATRGKPAAPAVHFAALRTLTQAEYSPALIGHFALASASYAHFTSPIRRYPDLTVHRALAAFLSMTDNGEATPRTDEALERLGRDLREHEWCLTESELVQVGRSCTNTERNAADAERDLTAFLILQYLKDRVGESFPGIVTGATAGGVFVRLDKYLAEGRVASSDLPRGKDARGPSRWRIDQRSGALVDESSGRSFGIGDRVEITITEIDLPARKMDLVITDPESRAAGKGKKLGELKLGAPGGGIGHTQGAGFKGVTGGERRSRKSKSRDKRKKDHRQDRKDKGKRQ